jgi:hypothetical protein
MMDTLTLSKGVITIPKLTTTNYEQWSEQLGYALNYYGLKKFVEYDNYEDYCRGKCLELSGFREEVCRESMSLTKTETEILEDIEAEVSLTLDPSGKSKKKISPEMVAKLKKQRAYFLKLVEDFDEQSKFHDERQKCVAVILSTISDAIREKVKKEESPYVLMSTLKKQCSSSCLGQFANAMKKICTANQGEKETLVALLNRMEALNRSISSSKFRLNDEQLWMMIVNAMHRRYETLQTVLISGNKEEAKLDKLRSSFANEDARLLNNPHASEGEEKDEANGLYRKDERKCYNCGKAGHLKHQCQKYSTSKERRDFRKKKNERRRERRSSRSGSSSSYSDSSSSNSEERKKKKKEKKGETHNLQISSRKKDERFYFDNACPEHVTNNLQDLQNVERTNYKVVSGGPKDKGTVSRKKGTLVLKTSTGNVSLNNVYFVEGYKRKLISIRCLDNAGAEHFGKDGKIEVKMNGKVFLQAELNPSVGLYAIKCQSSTANFESPQVMLTKEDESYRIVDSCF